jgi:hypothetical protein
MILPFSAGVVDWRRDYRRKAYAMRHIRSWPICGDAREERLEV